MYNEVLGLLEEFLASWIYLVLTSFLLCPMAMSFFKVVPAFFPSCFGSELPEILQPSGYLLCTAYHTELDAEVSPALSCSV